MSSGFTNAPITRTLIIASITLSILISLTDTKPFLPLSIRPHLVHYTQFWRLLTWPLAYTSSSSVLFSSMTLYNLRTIERLWGSRKFLSFILSTAAYTTLLPPLALMTLHVLSLGRINTLPSGPTALVFALLVQYHAAVPYSYKYNISWPSPTSSSSTSSNAASSSAVILTSKATTYLLPLQLALSSLPGSAIAATTGWLVGYAYRLDLLPGAATWRVPDLAGKRKERERFEGLRRRMEGEVGAGTGADAVGGDTAGGQGQARRRGVAGSILDQFRGVF